MPTYAPCPANYGLYLLTRAAREGIGFRHMSVQPFGVDFDRWLFTLVLALGFAATAAGAGGLMWQVVRDRSLRNAAPLVALSAAGLAVIVYAVEATRSGSRWYFVELQEQAEHVRELRLTMAYAGAIGLAVFTVAFVLLAIWFVLRRFEGRRRQSVALGTGIALMVLPIGFAMVQALDASTRVFETGRHPANVQQGELASAQLLYGGTGIVTGMAAAPTGEVFYAEHLSGRVGMLVPGLEGFVDQTFAVVDKPEDARLFHLAVHPDWPRQPYLYATVERDHDGKRYLEVVSIEANGDTPVVRTLISGLPTEDPAFGAQADHFGSGIAICGEYLFVGTGDTDSPISTQYRPGNVRYRAQIPDALEGKMLAYQLHDGELTPAGYAGPESAVFAIGFRNPFAVTCQPNSDLPLVWDNGPRDGFDQVRLVEAGTNHEWPFSARRDTIAPPLFSTGLTRLGASAVTSRATGGGVDIFFAGFNTRSIYLQATDADSSVPVGAARLSFVSTSAVLALTTDREGCVLFADAVGIWELREDGCHRTAVNQTRVAAGGSGASIGSASDFYRTRCATCHGLEREGAYGPALNAQTLTAGSAFYIDTILNGRDGTLMPAWRETGLTQEQAATVLEYLRDPDADTITVR